MEEAEITKGMELKSMKAFRNKDEYLVAMKEDLAEWLSELHHFPIHVENFFELLETGVILCTHANTILSHMHLPETLSYKKNVQVASFQARDNLSLFISFCRKNLKIQDTLLFESEDLVLRKNERSVVLCLLEVGRRGSSYGLAPSQLVKLEQEIDEEIEREEETKMQVLKTQGTRSFLPMKSIPQKKVIEVDMKTLDEMVRLILSRCTCEQQYPMIRVSEGKYTYGNNLTPIFLRVLRSHVMVRTGGGWDTLESFLGRHDPCRCDSKEHRGALAFKKTFKKKPKTDVIEKVFNKKNEKSLDCEISSDRPETPLKHLNDTLITSSNTLHLLNNVQHLIEHPSSKIKKVEQTKSVNMFKQPLNSHIFLLNKSIHSHPTNVQLSKSSKSLQSSTESIKSRLTPSRKQSLNSTDQSIPHSKSFISHGLNTTSFETSSSITKSNKTPRSLSARPRESMSKRIFKSNLFVETIDKKLSKSAEKLNDINASLQRNKSDKDKKNINSYLKRQQKVFNCISKSLNSSRESISSGLHTPKEQSLPNTQKLIPQSKSFVTPKVNRKPSNSKILKNNNRCVSHLRPISARQAESNPPSTFKLSQQKISVSVENIAKTEKISKSQKNTHLPSIRPRRDLKSDSKTKIPAPVSLRKSNDSLKRSDSGVDITEVTDENNAKNCFFSGNDFY